MNGGFLIFMVLLLIVMYVLMIRPQRQRQQMQQRMIDGANVGDDVLTTGGIYGTVIEVDDDDVVVEIADGLSVHMTRRGIAAVLPPDDDDASEDRDAEELRAQALDDAEADLDEAAVRADEEVVTGDPVPEVSAPERR